MEHCFLSIWLVDETAESFCLFCLLSLFAIFWLEWEKFLWTFCSLFNHCVLSLRLECHFLMWVCVCVCMIVALSLFSSLLFLLLLSLFFSLFVGRARQVFAFSRFVSVCLWVSLCVSVDIHVLEKTNGSIFSVRWLLLFSFFLHIDNRLRWNDFWVRHIHKETK